MTSHDSITNIIKEKAMKFKLNSIKLETVKASEENIMVGNTKIGGRPDLPKEISWPLWNGSHLSFIAQINLDDISKYDQENVLPHDGLLYFFYDSEQSTWGFDPNNYGSWKAIYYNGDRNKLMRIDFPLDIPDEARYKACKAEIKAEVSLPAWGSIFLKEMEFSKEESDTYFDLLTESDSSNINKLLGFPNEIQGDMQLECQLVSNGLYCGDSTGYQDPKRETLEKSAKDWRLLLQIDSDENCEMMWGDSGRIYFWIRIEDLKNKEFEKVWMILQCY